MIPGNIRARVGGLRRRRSGDQTEAKIRPRRTNPRAVPSDAPNGPTGLWSAARGPVTVRFSPDLPLSMNPLHRRVDPDADNTGSGPTGWSGGLAASHLTRPERLQRWTTSFLVYRRNYVLQCGFATELAQTVGSRPGDRHQHRWAGLSGGQATHSARQVDDGVDHRGAVQKVRIVVISTFDPEHLNRAAAGIRDRLALGRRNQRV